MGIRTSNKSGEKTTWQLQEAKAMFSEVIKEAIIRPQIITVYGKETAVILSIEEYKKSSGPKQTLYEFIQSSPLRGVALELPERLPEDIKELGL